MGNANSQDGISTTNTEGEDVVNFNLFGGGDSDQVVVTRDFSLDLVDYVNYDDQYLEKKYPQFKEQQAHFDALLDSFTRCNLDMEVYYANLNVPNEYRDAFIEVCPMNDYTKFRTGKFNKCLDGIFPLPARKLKDNESHEIHNDITYCIESKSLQEDYSIFESRRMRWSEPETLIQVRPKIMSMLKSLKFKPNSDEATNTISNYYFNEGDSATVIEEKLCYIRDQAAEREYQDLLKCTEKDDSPTSCLVEKQVVGTIIGVALCKKEILECLARNSSLHGNKLEEVAALDFVNCISASTCFSKIN